MNASLASLSTHVVSSFKKALSELSITVPFYISQNDGTLMTAELVEQYPVLTFASGPTNSMRGAAYLSGLDNALVADIGGTTTDIGMLVNGFPRESSVTVDIGNVRTNFRMPDVFAIGLGGGSIVRDTDTPTVGPDSVGYKLTKEAMVFGGSTLTTSDIAVAAGYADMGDPTLVKDLAPALVDDVVRAIHTKLENAIDKMKTSSEDLPVILVGGGSVLINGGIKGASEIIRPNYAPVANAIGASIAQVGGEVDRVYSYSDVGRDAA
ncbi:MAG: hydantoinase/oxoprolinase family protein, partial [Candidatus Azotimanducaceae bacterium WSBS_2022_MAG_OTU7]